MDEKRFAFARMISTGGFTNKWMKKQQKEINKSSGGFMRAQSIMCKWNTFEKLKRERKLIESLKIYAHYFVNYAKGEQKNAITVSKNLIFLQKTFVPYENDIIVINLQ